jgi:hypothetical protein
MIRSTTRTLAILAVTLSSLVIAGSALGSTRPDDRAGVRGTGGTAASTQVVVGEPGLSARPDNRAGVLGVGTGAGESTLTVATVRGFDWADAGIGAGATAGVLLVIGAAAVLAIPRRQHGRAIA